MKTKLHTVQNARALALDVLVRVEQEGAYSNIALNRAIEKAELERTDVALATELVYGTIQRLNTLDHFLDRFVNKGTSKLQVWVRNLLRMSLYQILYLERIPAHAAVNEAVVIAKKRGHARVAGMVNAVLRNVLRRQDELRIQENDPIKRISLQHSHPEWLVRRWVSRFGVEMTERMCEANNEPPKVSVRVNTLKHSREQLLREFAASGVEADPSEMSPVGVVIREVKNQSSNMAHSKWYRSGEISIQDESSMLVADIVAPEPGMSVLDCCAAPGGKTTHLAEKMGDDGVIWANDVHPHKERLIAGQAERLGLQAVRTLVSDAGTLFERFPAASFDRILLDAPCSGLGVIRRKPDLKWVKHESSFEELAAIQLRLLHNVADLLKPGGILVYSTCTMEYTENEQVVHRFISERSDFALDEHIETYFTFALPAVSRSSLGMVQIFPHEFQTDGFFFARLKRTTLHER